jgi:hypothetical protein
VRERKREIEERDTQILRMRWGYYVENWLSFRETEKPDI